METDPWRRLEELFEGALARPASERGAWLDARCEGDAAMRERVEAMLALDPGADLHLADLVGAAAAETGLWPDPGDWPALPAAGDELGAHRIVGEIGRGGMGVVYLAERADDAYRGRVAIKLVAMAQPGALRRFEQERQILADLVHPNIARLLDGGTTPSGLPYLVMELVEGIPIDAWCRERQLPVADRLRLFVASCDAVAHAHAHLVVHRDIKPGNILVTSQGPKLIDFGIASLLDPGAAGADITRATGRLLTPSHASPEHVRGERVTAASDVYSLGVLLYQLLADALPYRVETTSAAELERIACETVPPPPSATAPSVRRAALRGDLDTIVMKALEKEPARRYRTARELADDVQRHLEHRPVLARRATWTYRAGRALRRHRAASALAAVAVLALVAGATASTVGLIRARRERERAAREADAAGAVTSFLQEMLTSVQPDKARGRDVTVREILARAESSIGDWFDSSPEVEGTIRFALGQSYQALGDNPAARPLLERAVELRRQAHGTNDPRYLEALDVLGMTCWLSGDLPASLRCSEEALAIQQRRFGADSLEYAEILANIANTRADIGQPAEAEAALRRVLAIERPRLLGEKRLDLSYSLNNLATVLADQRRFDEAIDLNREALSIRRELDGADSPSAIVSLGNLGFALNGAGRLDEAEAALREAITIGEATLGPRHGRVARARITLAGVLAETGRLDEAETTARAAVDGTSADAGATSWLAGAAHGVLGSVLAKEGRRDEARTEMQAALDVMQPELGAEHPRVMAVKSELAALGDEWPSPGGPAQRPR